MKTKSIHPTASNKNPFGKCTLFFLSGITFAGATVIDFDLSPAGSGAAEGLRPANQIPVSSNSRGSGNAISRGITFDTATSTLSFAMGYGSAAGFRDLTGASTGVHIHGPAGLKTNAPVLFNLSSVHFPAHNPEKGGLIYGSVVYTRAQAASLLSDHNYVDVRTAAYPNGEIRGQLVRVNAAPDVVCQPDVRVECGKSHTYTADVSDFDGDAVLVIWSLNSVQVKTSKIAAGGPPSGGKVSYSDVLPDGSNSLEMTATDSYGNVTTCRSTITVGDTTNPVIVTTTADPQILAPANHRMIPVHINAMVKDGCGDTSWKILSVRSNQAVDADGSNTSPDWKIMDDHNVQLRAERSGSDPGDRVYVITVQATDEQGNKSKHSEVRVTVPH